MKTTKAKLTSKASASRKISEARPTTSPAVQKAKKVAKKHVRPGTPGKGSRVRRALFAIRENEISIRQAARDNELSFEYLYRRLSREVEIDRKKGPPQVFTREEEAMARWLREMAERGMGLRPGKFLDFVQIIVERENRSTPFKNNRPSHDWYYAFMKRNCKIVEMRKETLLENCRAKLTKNATDKWFGGFRDFLARADVLDKPSRIWNADETGFCMGSSASKQKIIGPPRKENAHQVPHVSGGNSKQRLTVMFCGSADGRMMPPFLVYPSPQPRGYNPLTGAIEDSEIAYTKKGWMDADTFCKFIQHFDKHAGTDRPVVLLIDSVSSHVHMAAFEDAKARGIEIYRIVPNATHLMQPLDKGVFGPLKAKWHQVVRHNTRDHPDIPIGKVNFAEKLKEAFLLFYKPLTIINSFKAPGIYPVDSTVISSTRLKPTITYKDAVEPSTSSTPHDNTCDELRKASGALVALESVLSTLTRETYHRRIQEGYDIEGKSPCFDAYRLLYMKANGRDTAITAPQKPNSLLTILTTYHHPCEKHLCSPVLTNQGQSGLQC
ncbi:PREDICTED: uncharacterized protein LOC106814043 [Priapulus caudatus]|uniref:Uncharacterized protein LOC106814043 n=1 Tax=Priapulus caudatus TaxID=37621 RepID=A0ABM1ENM0_PRICU|nr:PREDICTED: uncharacterized protein LOC106814043 [Priapulus caudatus]